MTSYSLTQSQLLLWAGQKMQPQSPLYNMAFAFELQDHIQVGHFQKAFQVLVNKCDSLRTIFEVNEGLPIQIVQAELTYNLEFLDLSQVTKPEETYQDWINHHKNEVFELETCLFRAVLIKLSENRFVWFLNLHHLIIDAWAVTILYKTMAKLYQRSLNNEAFDDISLPPFQDYINYEREARHKTPNQETSQYWKELLSQSSPAAPKLYGKTIQKEQTDSKRIPIQLGAERSERIRQLVKEKEFRSWSTHLSIFNFFSTALFAYLFRVSKQKQLAIGTPAHNRISPVFKEMPGLFIELFPMITEIEEASTFIDLLQKVKIAANAFLKNAQPGTVNPEIGRSFHVVLNYITATFPDFGEIPATTQWIHPDHIDAQHFLRLQVHDYDNTGNIQLYFDINYGVFDEALIQHAPEHFLKILDLFLENPNQKITEGNILGESEKTLILEHSLSNSQNTIETGNILSSFLRQCAQTPNQELVFFEDQAFTYQEIDQRSNQLANYLLAQGIRKGDRVGLYFKRSPEFIISIWAVLKTGASYVSIPSDYPTQRVAFIIQDADLKILLSHNKLSEKVNFSIPDTLIINLSTVQEAIDNQESTKPNIKILADDLAYLIYTSGSTGQPKGVMISHAALNNYIQSAANLYPKNDGFHFPLFTSIGFDLTVTSIFLPQVTGGSLRVYEENDAGPDLAILDVIQENKVNILKLTPSHLGLIKGRNLSDSRIKAMIVGGEDFKTELANSIYQSFQKPVKFYNEYGPSEATVGCVVHLFAPEADLNTSVPIGKPFAQTQALVLDENLQLCPKGVPGELYLAGPGLAKGYWKQEDLSAERFMPSPFQDNALIYKTGDLVRYLEDFNLEYLGRIDQQLKISGMRIEPGEIEASLSEIPRINLAIVTLKNKSKTISEDELEYCTKCGLPSNYPNVKYDENGVCNLCLSFESYQKRAQKYFKNQDDLKRIFKQAKSQKTGEYDCMMLLSGGKDSTYALARLVEMGA